MVGHLPALSPEQQILLQVIYDAFRSTGKWPTYQHVDKELDRRFGFDLVTVMSGLPPGFLGPDPRGGRGAAPPMPGDPIGVTIRGLHEWAGASPTLVLFVRTVQYLVQRERQFQPSSPSEAESLSVSGEEVRAALTVDSYGPTAVDLAPVYTLLLSDGYISDGGGGSPTGPWHISVSSRIRRYRDAYSIEQYLDRIEEATIGIQAGMVSPTHARVDPPVQHAFVLMPFDLELGWLFDELAAAGHAIGVAVERADDVFAAGVVVEQVKERIENADVVIAVCTGRNANVFYELGIADRLHRPILIAEQRDDLPFDIQHFRAHFYGAERETLRVRITRAMSETLAARSGERPTQ